MRKETTTLPVSIEFPSFGPSLNTSPNKIEDSSTFQSISSQSQEVHRISIHLPEEYLENNDTVDIESCSDTLKEIYPQISKNNSNANAQQHESMSNIRVYCRLRDSKKSKDSQIRYDCTMVDDGENCYSFDYIFGKTATQDELFTRIATRHIDDFFIGKNSTIFAYGQTGSGKTHTMFGNMSDSKNYGIIPKTLEEIFKRDLTNSTISCSMLEIYNEKLMDLFTPLTNSNTEIKLKEYNDIIFLDGLQEVLVENEFELLNLIRMGHKGRKIAATMANDVSSRSHTILFLYRNFKCKGQDFRTKMCFIDLAGSEKIRKSGVKGETLKETQKINLSLSCLGNVIYSLTNGSDHIPYRNSKLTRILKDSLSTDTSTSIITTCSLDQNDHQETLSTIKFAVRAKKIKNKKKLDNEDEATLEEEYIKLKKELEETKKQLEHYKMKEIEDEEKKENEIPEEVQKEMQPIRSICVITHGVSSRVKMIASVNL